MNPTYLIILSALLLIQSPRTVQSFSLNRLCGSFGHKCFGANWGKRTLPDGPVTNSKKNENDVLDDLQLELFRERLRQLFQLD